MSASTIRNPKRKSLKHPRPNRIQSRRDFLRIQSRGRKFRSPHFLLIVAPASSETASQRSARLGVTVTTKVDKRAVERNRLRRRIKELFRLNQRNFRYKTDLVVIALNESTKLSFDLVRGELSELAFKARLLPQRCPCHE